MKLISFLLDILSKVSPGYSSAKIMNHKLGKRKPETRGGQEGSLITLGETTLHCSLSPPSQLLCGLGTVCPTKRSHKETGNRIPEPTFNYSHQ